MIYGDVSESMTKLASYLTERGMIKSNEEIFVKYMDMDSSRDDSLLKKVKMTSAYGKSITSFTNYSLAVKKWIIKPRDSEIKSRFVCFLWAAFGASCVANMMDIVNSYESKKYYDVLLECLTPWVGETTAKLWATAGASIFAILRANESKFVAEGRSANEIAAIADLVCETNYWAARVMYAMALDKADE